MFPRAEDVVLILLELFSGVIGAFSP